MKSDMPPHKNVTMGWRYRNHSWETPDMNSCGVQFLDRSRLKPCLFNIQADPQERNDLSAQHPELMNDLWTRLNTSFLTWYEARSPNSMLGPCNKKCASAHWKSLVSNDGPICGVPGCHNIDEFPEMLAI